MQRRSFSVSPRQFLAIISLLVLTSLAGSGQMQMGNEYQCSSCKRKITVPFGQDVPKSCPHCGVRFDWVREQGQMSKQIKHDQPVSNSVILGVLCLLFTLGIVGGGVFLLVKLLSGSKKRPKRKRRSRPRDDFDEDDDHEDDEDDRPRRRRRNREDD